MLEVLLTAILVLAALQAGVLLGGFLTMKQSLTDAVNALVAETADTQGKLDSIETFIRGVPALAAAAVADALAATDAEEEAAAAQIETARQTISDKVDEALDAISANPAPSEEPAPAPAPVEEPPADTGEQPTT